MNICGKFKFVKELKVKEGTFPVGADITVIGDKIFYNDGQIQPQFYDLFYDLIEYELNEGFHYLREIAIPMNKI